MFRRFTLAMLALLVLAVPARAEKLVVAMSCDFPPLEGLNEKKEPVGFTVDYVREAGKRAGFEPEFRNVSWDGIFAGLNAGNYDMIASSTTITPEREKAYLFSKPYFSLTQAVILPKDKTMTGLADLKGMTVGSQIGITGVFVLRKADVGAIIKEYDDVGLAIADLAAGRIDAVICDDPVARNYANKRKDFEGRLHVAFRTGDTENFGFCLPKKSVALAERINKAIDAMRADGTEAAIIEKWMGK